MGTIALLAHVHRELAEKIQQEAKARNLSISGLLERILEHILDFNESLTYKLDALKADLEDGKDAPLFASADKLITYLNTCGQ